MKHTSLVALICVLITSDLALAQTGWLSVIAKSRSAVHQVESSSGKTVNHRLEYGRFYQRSDGSYVKQTFFPGSQDKVAHSLIYDAPNGILYQLDYAKKQASARHLKTATTPAPASMMSEGGAPQIINGIECIPYPVYGREFGTRVRVGTICQTRNGSVAMRYESSLNQSSVKGTMVSELYDVQLGHEPDPNLFKVPTEISVTTGNAE